MNTHSIPKNEHPVYIPTLSHTGNLHIQRRQRAIAQALKAAGYTVGQQGQYALYINKGN